MRKVFIVILLLGNNLLYSQNFFTSVFGGISNYKGDLQEAPFSILRTRPAWGIGLLFELNERFLIRGDYTAGTISGGDVFGNKNRARNLTFTSSISEFSIGLEYVPIDLYQYKVSPYFFASLGAFKFSPYVTAENGSKVVLYEFDTEGQGFYEGRKKYKLTQFCIPFGGGLQWAISRNVRFALVGGVRKTFTDYIDDVSTTYVDKDLLAQKRGLLAVSWAYRGNQVPNGLPYPPGGTPRGNPANNDWYYFVGGSLRFRLGLHGKKRVPEFRIRRASVKCPVF
jgi:hypothetical protein